MAEKRNRRLPEPRPVKGRPDLWAVDVRLPGVARRKRLYGDSYDACTAKMITLLEAHAKGKPSSQEIGTVGEYLTRWLEGKGDQLRDTSRARYRHDIDHHIGPAIGKLPLARLQSADVKALLAGLTSAAGRPLAPRSVQSVRDTLRAALNDALGDDLVIRNVAQHVKVKRGKRTHGTALTLEQAKALLAASRGTRFEAFVACCLALGLRLGTALALRWADVDIDHARLTITHQLQNLPGQRTLVEELKTEDSAGVRELPPFAVAALRRHRATVNRQRLAAAEWIDHDLVLPAKHGQPWAHQSFRNAWFRFLETAGFVEHWNPHDLRRSCNTLLLAAGVPPAEVMRYIGHRSIEMTMGTYNRLTQTSTAPGTLERLLGEGEG